MSPHSLCYNEEASSSFFWHFATHHGCCNTEGQQQGCRDSQQWRLVSLPERFRTFSCRGRVVACFLIRQLLPFARHGEGFYHARSGREQPVMKFVLSPGFDPVDLVETLTQQQKQGESVSLGYGGEWLPCGQVSSCMAAAASANFLFIL